MQTHAALKKEFPKLLTIIIPRHPTRGNKIQELANKLNLANSLRSEGNKVTLNTDIYIADTIGELAIFYKLINIVFVGGSMINHGGQNILEPAHFNAAIITGKYTHNFKEIISYFKKHNALVEVNNQKALEEKVKELLSFPKRCEKLQEASFEIMQQNVSILENTIQVIRQYI